MFYSSSAREFREFMRDKLGFSGFDTGGGWLIFDGPEVEIAAHPTDHEGSPPSGTHAISFYCDDLEKTIAELTERGVEFTDEIKDVGYGRAVHFKVPGGFELELYQPHYAKG